MLLIRIIIAINLFAYAALSEHTYCHEILINSQKNSESILYSRHARYEHLLELVKNSYDKFNLMNNLYLHYRSINNSTSELSVSLELCLINLLNIPRTDPDLITAMGSRNFFWSPKFQDPVHDFIAGQIVNINFYKYNSQKLERLAELDNLETSLFTSSDVIKADFDKALGPSEPKDIQKFYDKLLITCEEVMAVDYYNHTILYNFNLGPVHNFIDLVGNLTSTEDLKGTVAAYLKKPEAKTFDQIRIRVREIYKKITKKSMGLSPSEYWAVVMSEVEEAKQENINFAKKEAERFRAQKGVQEALLAQKKISQAQLDLEQIISPLDIEKFNHAYETLLEFLPKADKHEIPKIAQTLRNFIKNRDFRTKALDSSIAHFDGSIPMIQALENDAQRVYDNVIKLSNNLETYEKLYNANKSLLKELERLENYAEKVAENIQNNISRAKTNSFFRDLKRAKESAHLMFKALGESDEIIRARIDRIFFDDGF